MIVGIDFGTSFSEMATLYANQLFLLLNPGEYGIPSEFYYDGENGILVGQDALDAGQGTAAANLVSEIKMGLLSGKTYTLDGRTFTAKDIVKEIDRYVLTRAMAVAQKQRIPETIEGLVISVPAKFGMQECDLIAEAARDALPGKRLPIRGILKEPVAAAISYYRTGLPNGTRVLVYDLGGGTCDIALVEADDTAKEHYTVIDSDMLRLGGRDWDRALISFITGQIEKKSGVTVAGNIGYEEKIRRAAIAAKHDLSDSTKTRTIARVEINGQIYPIPISRATFDELTMNLLAQTLDATEAMYGKYPENYVGEIICVGGASNMLQVEEGLRERFPGCQIRLFAPEHAVVNGAALYASLLQNTGSAGVTDIAAFSYGVEAMSKNGSAVISNIIKQGDTLPATVTRAYHPIADGQGCVIFSIYETDAADDEIAADFSAKHPVGDVTLALPPNAPRDLTLHCEFTLDANGMLSVTAKEATGQRVNATFDLKTL